MQVHAWRAAFFVGLQEPRRAQAPTVPCVQSDKPVFRTGRAKVVADIFRKREKLSRHHSANCMAALISRAGIAGPIAKEPGHRIKRTFLQRAAQYIKRRVFFHINQGFLQWRGTCLRSGGQRRHPGNCDHQNSERSPHSLVDQCRCTGRKCHGP